MYINGFIFQIYKYTDNKRLLALHLNLNNGKKLEKWAKIKGATKFLTTSKHFSKKDFAPVTNHPIQRPT